MILLIGPKLSKQKTQIGGSEVLFENWINWSNNNDICMEVIDANKFNYCSKVIAIVLIICAIIVKAFKCEKIFLHGSKNDYLVLAPFAVLIGKILKKPVFLRKFAGSFHTVYEEAPWWKRILYYYTMKYADILFWETKSLVEFGKNMNINSYWFPNVRNRPQLLLKKYPYRKKFVFMSQVRKEKGIDILLRAFQLLGNNYQIDIYGSLMGYEEKQLEDHYKGCVASHEVYNVLSEYDCLLLPSYNEGYPGIIIEAYSVGLPVIATNVGGIPEIIENDVNGYLIEPNDPNLLVDAIRTLDNADYDKLSRNALESFDNFDANVINSRIYKVISN